MSRRFVLLAVAVFFLPSTAFAAPSDRWAWPLDRGALADRFDRPAHPYGAGHRGVDLLGTIGDPVRAVAAGQVAFAGKVGGVFVVTVDHGRERSTYQPVSARVRVGDAVTARQVIGELLGGPSHCSGSCLHLGRIRADMYLDPLELMSQARFALIDPDGPAPPPPAGAGGTLARPVGGPVTSPFGMRVHPLTGIRKLHDGTDFGVPCGTPVHAAADGTVISAGVAGAYGIRVTLQHAGGLVTSYAHLSEVRTTVGGHVSRGSVIALSGTTGSSTGCHLHFMVIEHGHPIDPAGTL